MMHLLHFPELPSTNNYAHEHINELADSTVIVADRQTAGRGQLGKSWVSDNLKNIYISIVLKPNITPDSPLLLNMSQITGKVIAQVIQELCPQETVRIKQPNDILVNRKKLCGILIETVIQGQVVKGVIVGIGINVQLSVDERKSINQPATALQDYNKQLSKAIVMNKVLKAFFVMYATVSR